jgi:hypothetical protein
MKSKIKIMKMIKIKIMIGRGLHAAFGHNLSLNSNLLPALALNLALALLFALPRSAAGEEPGDWKADRSVLTGIEDRTPVRNAEQNYYEASAYSYLLIKAYQAPEGLLVEHARRDLTMAHLKEEPAKYRGELIHVEGQLKRVRRFDAPALAAKEGVQSIYECWIFPDGSYDNPYCVITSELHAGIYPAESMSQRAALDGYLFKLYRYKTAKGWRDSPLLIGKTIGLTQPAESDYAGETGTANDMLLPAFLVVIVATAVLAIGLTWWYRRGDRRAHKTMQTVRSNAFPADDFFLPEQKSQQ